jgi:flagellar assembly protein FliH
MKQEAPGSMTARLVPAAQIVAARSRRVVGRIDVTAQATLRSDAPALEVASEDALAAERDALVARLDRTREELEAMAGQLLEREQAAFERGIAEGEARARAAAVEQAATHEARVVDGIATATRAFEDALARLHGLSSALAMLAVEQIVGDELQVKERVVQVLRHQLDRLLDQRPFRVRVSAEDFPDAEPIRMALRDAGYAEVDAIADSALASGSCRIQLRMGEVDAGVPQQLKALSSLLNAEAGNER